ncbi:response regulator transcription factor [bacterium]|nr:response regulator transcription factor [candidate division CSSED10-310 bacterium]
MANAKIVIVDDDPDILELLEYNFAREGYQVFCFGTGEGAVEKIREIVPDCLILDLMLPGMGGLDICKRLKQEPLLEWIPVIMLTAKGEDADVVTGLELGAEDYVTKPFSPRVLLARVRAILRRKVHSLEEETQQLKSRQIMLIPALRDVRVSGESVELTATEFDILYFLMKRPGWVFQRNQIITAIKGDDYPVTDRSIDVQIVSLRKKLGKAGSCIKTVRGVGYRFQD